MANEQNLQPGNVNHTFTPEETLKGVQRSIEVRQEKSRMKKILKECMKMKSQNKKYKDLPMEYSITLGLLEGAENGNARNYETIVTMLGEAHNLIQEERETQSIEINVVDNSDLEKIMYDKRKE